MDPQLERFFADGDFGAARFRFAVGPLDYRSWLRLQTRLIAFAPKKKSLPRVLFGLLVGCLIGLPLGVALVDSDASAMLIVVTQRPDWIGTLTDGGLVIAGVGAVLLIYFLAIWQLTAWRGRLVRGFFDGAVNLHRPSEIALSDQGVLCSSDSGVSFVRWSSISDLFETKGVLFLIADRAMGYWIDESALGSDRDAAIAFIRSKLAPPA